MRAQKIPTKLLQEDHDRFKDLFREFEETEIFQSKKQIFAVLAAEIKIHSAIEEELFYPAVLRRSEQEALVAESVQEHHVIDLLIAELEDMNPVDESGEAEFVAKAKVLKENLEHHIDEEELEMFPQADECGLEDDAALAGAMARRREELAHYLHL